MLFPSPMTLFQAASSSTIHAGAQISSRTWIVSGNKHESRFTQHI